MMPGGLRRSSGAVSTSGARSGASPPSGGVEPAFALDQLAATLRERLLAEAAGDGPGDLEGRIRALVERQAAVLDVAAREALVARVAERSFGLGPLEPLLRDPAVDEVMVNGAGTVWVERDGRLAPTDVRFA